MSKHSPDSLVSSLKGKIRFASVAFAIFVCGFGLFSFLSASFFVSNPLFAVFLPFVFLSLTVVFLGWWLAGEVTAPIEKISLLAKSLERSPAISLPRTTGSTETDEILHSLHRTSQQLQTIVGLMDKVAGGQLDVVLTPLQNSDRLSNSFQTLLAKVSESIHAKQELEKLESAVVGITTQIARIRRNNLDVELTADFPETREISETIKYLTHHLNRLIVEIRRDSTQARGYAVEIRQTIKEVISEDENKIRQINQAVLMLKQIPGKVQKISQELADSVTAANFSIEKAKRGAAAAEENVQAANQLRKQIQEAIKRLRRLGERSQEIAKTVKTVEDLAHRTNLVALNASIQAIGLGEKGYGFTVLAEEIEQLSARAENAKREISSLNKSIAAEISEVETGLQTTVGEAANLSKYALETGDSLGEMEKYVGRFLNLQSKLSEYSYEQAFDTEKSFEIFNETIGLSELKAESLNKSAAHVGKLLDLMETLENSAADFKSGSTEFSPPVAAPARETAPTEEFVEAALEYEPEVSP